MNKNSIATHSRYWRLQVPFASNTRHHELTGCIEWTGTRHPQGYGLARRVVGEPIEPRAHRRAWIMAHGPIPDGMLVLHSCDNPCCVNVEHLRLGTDADNSDDKYSRGRNRNLRGTAHGMSRLLEEDVLRIREAHLFGAKLTDLGRIYGVSDVAISHVVRRKNWAHVE
jgi:hypothetical protein